MSHVIAGMSAESALDKLKEGNSRYLSCGQNAGDVSDVIRRPTAGIILMNWKYLMTSLKGFRTLSTDMNS